MATDNSFSSTVGGGKKKNLGKLCVVVHVFKPRLLWRLRHEKYKLRPAWSIERQSQNKVEEELGRLLVGPACVRPWVWSLALQMKKKQAAKMAQWLKAVVILAEDPGTISSTSMASYNQL